MILAVETKSFPSVVDFSFPSDSAFEAYGILQDI